MIVGADEMDGTEVGMEDDVGKRETDGGEDGSLLGMVEGFIDKDGGPSRIHLGQTHARARKKC